MLVEHKAVEHEGCDAVLPKPCGPFLLLSIGLFFTLHPKAACPA